MVYMGTVLLPRVTGYGLHGYNLASKVTGYGLHEYSLASKGNWL